MQTIKHENGFKYFNPLLADLETLYSVVSDDEPRTELFPPLVDVSLEPVYDMIVEQTGKEFGKPSFKQRQHAKHTKRYDAKNIIVCYSGGKDSLSVVLHYMKMGYNVYAYHIKGLNKGYYNEWEIAEEASREIGFNLIIDQVSYSGQHVWTEHPMKNMLMATMALNYGVTHGITTKIAVGDFRDCSVDAVAFSVTGGDTVEMWDLYTKFIRTIIPNFKVYIPNKNYATAYNMLLKHPNHIKHTMSCMTPNRFRESFRKRTQKNYGVELLEHRCGCCSKCAVEYIIFCDHGVFQLDRQYYIHCLEILAYTSLKEEDNTVPSINRLWGLFFFYPMKKSKLYRELSNAIIQNGKIKLANEIA